MPTAADTRSPTTRMDFSAASTAGAATTSMKNNQVLTARGIGKTVKSGDADLVILRDIDLAVTPGEAVAIAGASGSGKSTLLAILAGLDTPSSGTVELDGQDLFRLDEDARAELRGRAVGFVFPSFQLLAGLALGRAACPRRGAGDRGGERFERRLPRRPCFARDRARRQPAPRCRPGAAFGPALECGISEGDHRGGRARAGNELHEHGDRA